MKKKKINEKENEKIDNYINKKNKNPKIFNITSNEIDNKKII